MYWTANGRTFWRAPFSSSSPRPARQFITGTTRVGEVAVSSRYVYWANGNAIGRANLNGTDVNQRFITGASFAVGVTVSSKYIYWSNNASYTRSTGFDRTSQT